MKQYIVIGLGNFGYNIAIALSELGHHVLVIDSNRKKIEQIKDRVTHAVIGDATDKELLAEFITDSVDAVIVGLGSSMEANILTTLYLKDLKVKKIIAKAVSDDHGKILTAIGAHQIVYPERDVAVRMAKELTNPNLIEHIPLAPEYSIVTIAAPQKFVGKTLKELQLRTKYGVEVIAIKDVLADKFYMIPSADFRIGSDNALLIIGEKNNIDKMDLLK
ncbi:MAG: potassium channel family protein [bacterium]